jgi:signal transduction histidine kinase
MVNDMPFVALAENRQESDLRLTKSLAEVSGHLTEPGAVFVEQLQPGQAGFGRYINAADRNNGSFILSPGDGQGLGLKPMPHSSDPTFALQVHLADANLLFARQRQRTLLFGGLILLSTLAAVVGLVAAYRAFRRQLRLSDMKSNFVSSVSHELRAPIASVRLMAESLERGKIPDAPRQQEYFRFISQECRRLSSLIENVLDFSRIDQGRKQYEFEPTDLVALTQQTVKLMEPYAAEKQVQLALALNSPQLSAICLQLSVDGKALQQALINLIDNAIKHSPKGETVMVGLEVRSQEGKSEVRSPKSEVRNLKPEDGGGRTEDGGPTTEGGRQTTDDGRQTHVSRFTFHAAGSSLPAPRSALLWVEDHGPGIPAAEHEKIFERFYRLGSELRRETQGVGIGLSIVKHVVEAHGGRVLVRSEVGQGSRFTIELPMEPEGTQSEDRTLRPEVRNPKSE